MKKILLVLLLFIPLSIFAQNGIYYDSVKTGDTTLNIRESGTWNYALIYMENKNSANDTIVVESQSYRGGTWARVGLIDLFYKDSTSYQYVVITASSKRLFLLNFPCPNWFKFISIARVAPGKRTDIEVNFKK